MAMFLRDRRITNRAYTESTLEAIFKAFADAKLRLEKSLASTAASGPETATIGTAPQTVFLSVVIRFDEQGCRCWTWEDLKKYFRQAKDIERIAFEIDTSMSLATSRQAGAFCWLQLDIGDVSRCGLQVSADEKAWVEETYAELSALSDKRRTVSAFVRTQVTEWAVQICGVTLGVLACIWVARFLTPVLSIDNPFIISFLFALLIFSNTWTHILRITVWVLGKTFPNVMFLRQEEERLHWVWQAVVAAIISVAVVKVGSLCWDLLALAVEGLQRKSTG